MGARAREADTGGGAQRRPQAGSSERPSRKAAQPSTELDGTRRRELALCARVVGDRVDGTARPLIIQRPGGVPPSSINRSAIRRQPREPRRLRQIPRRRRDSAAEPGPGARPLDSRGARSARSSAAGQRLLRRLSRDRCRPMAIDQTKGDVVDAQHHRQDPHPPGPSDLPRRCGEGDPVDTPKATSTVVATTLATPSGICQWKAYRARSRVRHRRRRPQRTADALVGSRLDQG